MSTLLSLLKPLSVQMYSGCHSSIRRSSAHSMTARAVTTWPPTEADPENPRRAYVEALETRARAPLS